MKQTSAGPSGKHRPPVAATGRSETVRRSPYVKPSVQPAGSVFDRTKALGSGSKDGLSGSALL